MESQTPEQEGAAAPTPDPGMSAQDSAPKTAETTAATKPEKSAEQRFIEETLGKEFDSLDQAKESLKNLNSMVGDQTVAKQRKALDKLAKQAGLTPDELIEVIETQDINLPQGEAPTQEAVVHAATRDLPDENTKRLTRLETSQFIKDTPEAAIVKDQLFAEALTSGKPVDELWSVKYGPIVAEAKKLGAKKLQSNIEGQPTRATSTASEESDTKPDFSKMSSRDMEKYIGYAPPSPRL